jgi:signal transduction histidine kinase
MKLRTRILLSLAPLAILLVAVGIAGFLLLDRMGGRIDAILKENYASVQAMFKLNMALERMDSSFQFALSTSTPETEQEAKKQFEANWMEFDEQYEIEANNITIHAVEDDLVARLRELRLDYRKRGQAFYAQPGSPDRRAAYFGLPGGDPGLLGQFKKLKEVSGDILRINRENMEQARNDARATAHISLAAFAGSMVLVTLLLLGVGWYLLRTILGPIEAVTEVAHAISHSGQLDRTVPTFGRDELGRLAAAFNMMTRELRRYRQTNLDRLLRAQKTAQATIDSFSDPVLVVDFGGKVELANPAASRLLGVLPADPSSGQPDTVWQPPQPLRQPVTEALQQQREYHPDRFDQAVFFQTGTEDRAYLPQVRPIRDPDGNTLGAAVVLNDITRFRLLDQFKSDLVATVSHELKTPLTSVRLAVHVLLEETIGPLTPKQTELLIDARDNAERLLTLIEQLLALARLQRTEDRAVLRREDPIELLRAAVESVRPRAEDKHVELELLVSEPVLPVTVDAERMGQALGNLLNNAITYTPAGGKVTLSAGTTDGRVVITIADTGVGIPAEYLPHVFDRFFRIPGHSEETGTGLGLAIVKETVTAHKGEVRCESEVGKGTTFRIVLPACTTPEASHGH